jgi:hypothetical protein
MSTSEQLERETERERARISETLEELRALMTPGQVVDRLVDYATESSGGMFFRNLRQQAVDNPVPVALVGAGLAWLAIAGRRTDKVSAAGDRMVDRVRHAAETARSAAAGLSETGQATASSLQNSARETADSAADAASSTYAAASGLARDATARAQGAARSAADSVAETASTTYGVAAEQARRAGDKLQKSASEMRGKVAASGRSIMDFAYEQPLVLVGLGLAIGAAIGAASPSTEAEDELMGETSDALKEQTADLAREHMKKGEAVAERAWQSATEEAEKQGLASGSTREEGAHTSQLDLANETPLVPSSEASGSREDERSKP